MIFFKKKVNRNPTLNDKNGKKSKDKKIITNQTCDLGHRFHGV